jgi:hypothetical protein
MAAAVRNFPRLAPLWWSPTRAGMGGEILLGFLPQLIAVVIKPSAHLAVTVSAQRQTLLLFGSKCSSRV